MNTRNSGNPIFGLTENMAGPERTNTIIGRLMGSVELSRALSQYWSGTIGLTGQRVTMMDDNSRAIREDQLGSPVTVSGSFHDHVMTAFCRAAFAAWGNTQLVLSAEKGIPVRMDWSNSSKGSIRAEKIIRLGPMNLVIYAKGGASRGKLPPYEAFPLGKLFIL